MQKSVWKTCCGLCPSLYYLKHLLDAIDLNKDKENSRKTALIELVKIIHSNCFGAIMSNSIDIAELITLCAQKGLCIDAIDDEGHNAWYHLAQQTLFLSCRNKVDQQKAIRVYFFSCLHALLETDIDSSIEHSGPNNEKRIVFDFISRHFSPDEYRALFYKAMKYSVLNNHKDRTKRLVKAQYFPVECLNIQNAEGDALVHELINNYEIIPTDSNTFPNSKIRYLLKLGASVNIKNDKGNTPLHCAFNKNNWALITLLLGSNANIEIRNNAGQSFFDQLIKNNVHIDKLKKIIFLFNPN